jgi:tetratricopeptide (TPR) repeat protein
LRLSRIRTEQGDEAAAERALLEGFARAPADAEIVHELSRRFTEAAQWQKLAELLGRALDARPENRGLTLRASEACRKAARYDRALELLDALGEQADAALVYERFVVLQAARRREEALAALEDAARLEPRYVEELERELEASLAELDPSQLEPRALGLAALVEQSGAGDRARDLLRRFSQTSPPPRGLLEKLAELERSAGSWMEAMSTYRRLLQLDLGDKLETTALALADACERAGRAADARADLERAVERAPKSTRLRERLRRLYDKIGARDQLARTYLREASEHADPLVRVGALVNAGVLMLETGNLGQAIGALERALEQEPAHIEAALLLAQAHESSGERQRALEVLLGAVGRHDKKRSKDVARLHARIGELHLRADDLVEALEALEKAFELDRTDAGAALLLGLLAVDLDRHRTAQQALQAVTAARPGITDAAHASSAEARSVAYYHLGRIARLAGDEPRARLMVTKAMRENPENRQARSFLDELGADA